MHTQLNQIVAHQHVADLHAASERVRLTRNVTRAHRSPRRAGPITRLHTKVNRITARFAPAGV
jgi:hypothetical protein